MTGLLSLTFDDRHLRSWVDALPAFDAAGARVTFFIVEADLLDADERAAIRTLLDAGHGIGSHGLRHRNADAEIAARGAAAYLAEEIDPSIDALCALGGYPSVFAYPNSRRDDASDAALLTRFSRLRGGGPRTLDPDAARGAIVPADSPQTTHPARGIDTGRGAEAHLADEAVLDTLLHDLADGDGSLILYAHDIAARGPGNHIHPDRLAAILARAHNLGLRMVPMQEIASEPTASRPARTRPPHRSPLTHAP
ncbi:MULTISPECIES: polysaccharide deacetylase family protein [Microbacterium]|uniref:polysaccharide deacetylase family protein n=1 Tax=Microbacterium TaxID=33882 RepID=UPI003010185C